MYDTAPTPAAGTEDDTTQAVQVALDRRDNGGHSGR